MTTVSGNRRDVVGLLRGIKLILLYLAVLGSLAFVLSEIQQVL